MKKERLLIQKSALEKMLQNIKDINSRFSQGLLDYAGDLWILGKLNIKEYSELNELIKRSAREYTYPYSTYQQKAWLFMGLIEVDKKLRRKEKINNFFGAIKGLFALNKLLKKWNFNTW